MIGSTQIRRNPSRLFLQPYSTLLIKIVRKQFQIAFYLDDHGKLRSYTIKEFLVGP